MYAHVAIYKVFSITIRKKKHWCENHRHDVTCHFKILLYSSFCDFHLHVKVCIVYYKWLVLKFIYTYIHIYILHMEDKLIMNGKKESA